MTRYFFLSLLVDLWLIFVFYSLVTYVPAILSINGVIAKLDVLNSFGLVAANAPIPYVRPVLKQEDEGILRLKQARHPVLEVQDSISFIPNDICMDKNETTFYIITGRLFLFGIKFLKF